MLQPCELDLHTHTLVSGHAYGTIREMAQAAAERGLTVVEIAFDDDDNVFEVTIDRPEGDVDLSDCEYVHRAVLAAFDRDVEDYSLTVTSLGLDAAEADAMLQSTNE